MMLNLFRASGEAAGLSRHSTEMKRKFARRRKTRKQKGGFSPMIFGNIESARVLLPLVARQAYRLWNSRKTRKRRSRPIA
jgi:hypothetical protein